MPTAQRELIDTEHSHPADRGIRQPTDHAQQRRPAHRHAQRGGQPGSGPPGQRQPDCRQRTVQSDAAAGVVFGQPRHLLDESACAAVDVVAEEPAHRQPEHDRPPRNGKISHPPPIAAVHPGRYPTAPPAATRPSSWPCVPTTHEISDRSQWLNDKTKDPKGLGSGRTCALGRRTMSTRAVAVSASWISCRDEDDRALPSGQVAPSLLGGHVWHAIPPQAALSAAKRGRTPSLFPQLPGMRVRAPIGIELDSAR